MRGQPSGFVAHVIDLMAPWAPVTARRMFGGYGLYRENVCFAIVSDETLYLKANPDLHARFKAAGSEPFMYLVRGRTVQLSYWRAPDPCLESESEMAEWCTLAWAVALQAATQRRRNARTKS